MYNYIHCHKFGNLNLTRHISLGFRPTGIKHIERRVIRVIPLGTCMKLHSMIGPPIKNVKSKTETAFNFKNENFAKNQ